MTVYKYSQDGNTELKRSWTRTMMIYYAVIILVLAYNLLYRNPTTLSVSIYAIIIIALVAAYIFGRRKYYAIIDNTELIVTDIDVTLHITNKPDVVIAYSNIKDIKQRKDGIYLQSKASNKPSVLVSNCFECFEEIEKVIADRQLQITN
ncbi:hypothetical protein [Mucilaginibacter phyllosphaerae]|uniref:DUF304 domain-containing protein n=1 Tax=Mucilaginibacter phyllosphaerae TaxID=1812349 RepID=A0A4Y8ABJ8_9SPHI|nr:hypothetical protein [Mucilaginibacter phyllosphaerae]MBB3969836.1 hypothetical protein [Mucilaginibacter phyllosphaerae]TEW65211.1 hypothetical protein E2R65_14965 [Mucilaginibacter phyllosphaerae]GGH17255.1 hypothetical protein GCM10007352_27240 [Mucilaginibacter phyllosphaerae]